eukprot:3501061-Prymnesium_polylepis.1
MFEHEQQGFDALRSPLARVLSRIGRVLGIHFEYSSKEQRLISLESIACSRPPYPSHRIRL